MIDYLEGYVLLAYRNHIVYLDVSKHVEESGQPDSSKVTEVKLEDSNLAFVDMDKSYKIVALQHMGLGEMTSLVLEHLKTRQIKFLRVDQPKAIDGTPSQKELRLVQLGQLNPSHLQPSPLLKYRTVAKIDKKTGNRYQASLVVRENGAFEVYSDFSLVNEYFNPQLQCVDIETDFDQFYLKFVKNVSEITDTSRVSNLEIEVRAVRHIWRNRISFSTMRPIKQIEKWNRVTHKRISRFFRLYTQILNFNMYMLVSHRNMISIYDMTQNSETGENTERHSTESSNGGWIKTFTFAKTAEAGEGGEASKEHIRKMFIKKRTKEERLAALQAKREKHKNETRNTFWLSSYNKY